MSEVATSGGETADADRDKAAADFDLQRALEAALRRGAQAVTTHVQRLDRAIEISGTKTNLHCYFLPVDANGRVRTKALAEFLRDQIIDYAIPRKTFEEARKQSQELSSAAPIMRLSQRAKALFTDLSKSGEGGELLLFAMAEAVFGLSQVLCKMTLKTSPHQHYHGADGVYVEARVDGGLNLYWGESKVYASPATAIRECLSSLAPFLLEQEGEDAKRNQDILLINEYMNFSDEKLVTGLKEFFDRDNPASYKTRHCGIALAAFDCDSYPSDDQAAAVETIMAAIRNELSSWIGSVQGRVNAEHLANFDIHFICVPMRSAEEFRINFREALGIA